MLRSLPLLAFVTYSSAISAQQTDDTITVNGRQTTREEIRREAQVLVRSTGIATSNKPAARWVDAICPTVKGVAPAIADMVQAKIETVATAAGARVARQPCQANIIVAFAANGSAMTSTIARNRSKIGGVPVRERKGLIENDVPLRWWYATDTRGRHGTSNTTGQMPWVGGDSSSAPGGSGQQGGGSPTNDMTTIVQNNSSIVSTQVNRVLTSATVIVDVTLATGKSLDAVAAQVAMVALAEIDRDARPEGSILSLFSSPSSGLDDLSDGDRALLKSLYGISLDRTGAQHKGRLVDGMIKAQLGTP